MKETVTARPDVIDLCEIWRVTDFPEFALADSGPRFLSSDLADPLAGSVKSHSDQSAPPVEGV